jgi:PAS domain S-box-containing protein
MKQSEADNLLRQREDLRESEERFWSAFESAAIGMGIVAKDGKWLRVNNSLCDMLGMTEQELLSTDFQAITHPDDLALDLEYVRRMLAGEIRTYRMEKRYLHKQGHFIWILLCVSLVHDQLGEPMYFLAQIQDISDLKAAHELSKRARLMEEREDFMATLTHDLKIPLLGANRILDLFMSGTFGSITEEQEAILAQLKISNMAQLRLIQNLLAVYRYERDVNTVDFEKINIAEVVRSCVDEFALQAINRDVRLRAELPVDFAWVQAESNSIRRVIQNLLDNALRFTPKGGEVSLSLRQIENAVVITVEDTGPGISEEQQDRLYQRFTRGKGDTAYAPSTGLGLYLCKKIIDAHGGEINCSSEIGCGSTFTVTIPTHQSEQEPENVHR